MTVAPSSSVSLENEVEAHDDTAGDAPIPERHWNHTIAPPLGGDPLHQKTHRENSVPDQAKNDKITPVQTEETMFLADPGDSDN